MAPARPLRIVHITATAVGAPWLVELAREQKKRGHEVTLLIPSLQGTIAAALQDSGVVCLAADVDVVFAGNVVRRGLRLASLVRLLRRLKPDVVHGHIINSLVTARLASWLADVPIRIGVNAGPLTLESELLRPIEIGTAFCDTYSVASCSYTLELMERLGIPAAQRELIFYAADERRFDPQRADGARVRRELGIDEETPLVGFLAYFYPPSSDGAIYPPHVRGRGAKGHEVLLHAARRVVAEMPAVRFALVGRGWGPDGPAYERALKELARTLGVEHAVLFPGERSDAPDTLASFDLSVHPSLSDNLGGTLESLLMARPMIVSDIPGYRDTVLDEKTGLVVPAGDADALAEAILRLLRDRALAQRLGQNGRQYMLERFTLQRCVDDVDALMARSEERAESHYRIGTTIARFLTLPRRLLPVLREVRRVDRLHHRRPGLVRRVAGRMARLVRDAVKGRPAAPASVRPRIAQVAGAWSNCQWFVDLCHGLVERGYDVIAVIDNAQPGDLGARLDAAGIRRTSVRMTFATRLDRLRLPVYLLNIPIAALKLAAILRRERVDIVHSHIFSSVVIGRIAAALARARHVAGIAGPRHLEAGLTRTLDRLLWWLDDVTVAGCRHVRDLYRSIGAREARLEVVYYGADEVRFDPARADGGAARAALGVAAEAPLVVHAANFYPPTQGPQTPRKMIGRGLKGHEDLLAAARIVALRHPQTRFVLAGSSLVGDGERYRQRLMEQCRHDELLRDRVIFAGHVEDVPSLLAAANVAVQCSLTENLGGTIEALLMEAPVVATRVGGMPESVRDGETGLLVPPSDPEALAAAILRLLEDRDQAAAFGRAGRRWMLEHFTAARMADDVDRIYRRLAREGAAAVAAGAKA